MQFTANKRALRESVARLMPLAGLPAFAELPPGILIEASHDGAGGYVAVTAGDGDVAQTVRIAATVFRAGSFAAEAKALRAALQGGRAGDEISFERDDETRLLGGPGEAPADQAWIGCEGVRHALAQGADPAPVKIAPGGTRAVWDSAALAEGLRRVAFAMSDEETRYYLRGVYIAREANGLAMVASDGHRLAATETPLAPGASDWPDGGIILPALAVRAIAKASGKEPHRVAVRANAGGIEIEGPGYGIAAKAIDGKFPDYKRLFPVPNAEGRAAVTFDLGAFGAAIRAAKPREGETVLMNGYASVGGRVALDNGPAVEGTGACFNARYLADIAGAFGGVTSMNYDREGRGPALFLSPSLPGFAALLMPFGHRR